MGLFEECNFRRAVVSARRRTSPSVVAMPPRELLHGSQHACCVSDPAEEQLDVHVAGATKIAILGDSLSSTEGRCGAYRPWPMLLQDALGRESYVVHGFGLPAISAAAYGGQQVYRSAASTAPDVLALMLGTNDAHWGFNEAAYRRQMTELVVNFQSPVQRSKVLLISPPPLWRNGIFGGMQQNLINEELPRILRELSTELGCVFVDINHAMFAAGFDGDSSCDGCHLYPSGQEFIARAVYQLITNLFVPPPSPRVRSVA